MQTEARQAEGFGSVREECVPVANCHVILTTGKTQSGEPCVYASYSQHSGDGGAFLIQIDPVSGACRRWDAAPGTNDARYIYWSERWQTLYINMQTSQSTPGRLYTYHAPSDCFRDCGTYDGDRLLNGMDMGESPDGSIWVGTHSRPCELFRLFPETMQFRKYGVVDPDECYCYIRCGDDGTVAALVRMVRPHVVLIDPQNGEMKHIGPYEDKNSNTGSVKLFKGMDGLLYIDSHEGKFRLQDMESIPVDDVPAPIANPNILPDGTVVDIADPLGRHELIRFASPDGMQKIINTDYAAAGTEIYITRAGPDGKLYGSSVLPLRFFSYDPATDKSRDHGQCTMSSGEVYSLDAMDNVLYFCSYTHAILSAYDLSQPIDFPLNPQDETGKKVLEEDSAWPCRMKTKTNPRQLGRMDTVAYRPRDMVAGPAGKVWVASVPDYGMWGGTLSWYDPKADCFGGAHRNIIPDCSPTCLTHLAEEDLLAVGFSIYGGCGTIPRAKQAGFALWDPHQDEPVWISNFDLSIVGAMDVESMGNGLVYAVVHPQPESTLQAELLLLDFKNKKIANRARLDSVAGWPLEVSFQRDEKYLYGATRSSIYRVLLGTIDIEIIWSDVDDGPTAPGALLNNRYYFSTDHRLRSVGI